MMAGPPERVPQSGMASLAISRNRAAPGRTSQRDVAAKRPTVSIGRLIGVSTQASPAGAGSVLASTSQHVWFVVIKPPKPNPDQDALPLGRPHAAAVCRAQWKRPVSAILSLFLRERHEPRRRRRP